MDRIEPKVLKGMRDFLPGEMQKREYVIDIIKNIFKKYGFEPLETPAIEYWDILSGKKQYGEEEKLIYKFKDRGGRDVGLRFDFTVPLARVIALHPEIPMPFRRYQIQPVWRADKPQKGRYREFYQCDVDIVGTNSMFADAEIIALTGNIFLALGFKKFKIKINNRKILQAMCKYAGVKTGKEFSIYRAMDKMEKTGIAGVKQELEERNIQNNAVAKIVSLLESAISMEELENILPQKEGILELKEIFAYLKDFKLPEKQVCFDVCLARGLDYYTGPIFEVVVEEPEIGSLAGGGRYDRLIGMFVGREIPATGITIGIERIMVVSEELGMLPERKTKTQMLIAQFDRESTQYALSIASNLRKGGIEVEVYPEYAKLSKQFKYADKRNIPFVVIAGPDEMRDNKVTIKDMESGKQKSIERKKLESWVRSTLFKIK